MVKTMLALLFLGALSTGAAETPPQAQCALDGVSAVNDMSNAAMFVWAATKRCGNPADSEVKCEIDIASAAQSASNMIATIAGAVAECGAVNADADCAVAVSGLTGAAAGLAAASGKIITACPNSLNLPNGLPDAGGPIHGDDNQATTLGHCIFDAKAAMSSLFSASKHLDKAADCKNTPGQCSSTAVNVMAALAAMGSSLAASVSDCSSIKGDGNDVAVCASGVLALVSSLNGVAVAGKQLKKGCEAGAARLYLEDEKNEEGATSSPSLTLAFAALLPMAAALSFAAGRYTRTSSTPAMRSYTQFSQQADEEATMLAPE